MVWLAAVSASQKGTFANCGANQQRRRGRPIADALVRSERCPGEAARKGADGRIGFQCRSDRRCGEPN